MTAHAARMPSDPASKAPTRRRFPGWRWAAAGLAAGAALVGYDTDLGALAMMGLVSGAALGTAQGLVLARQGRRVLALPWALAMPVLFALGWSVASATGIGVDD
jgi:hypothetical protein